MLKNATISDVNATDPSGNTGCNMEGTAWIDNVLIMHCCHFSWIVAKSSRIFSRVAV